MSVGNSIPPTPTPRPVYNYPPPPPPANSGNNVTKIILWVIGAFVLVCLIVGSIVGLGFYRVSKAMHRTSAGDSVTVTSPNGTLTTGSANRTLTSADLGVDLYPGAVLGKDSMKLRSSAGSMLSAIYTSTDPPAKIVDFYKDKLGSQAAVIQTGGGTMISTGTSDVNRLMITITPDGNNSQIVIVHSMETKH
jgi:hypothetical protein